jgi:hypothetical protein
VIRILYTIDNPTSPVIKLKKLTSSPTTLQYIIITGNSTSTSANPPKTEHFL